MRSRATSGLPVPTVSASWLLASRSTSTARPTAACTSRGGSETSTFLEQHEVPLKVAAELVRYERATNESRARRLTERYKESPLTAQEIVALRKRESGVRGRKLGDTQPLRPPRLVGFMQRFEAEARRDPSAISQLAVVLLRLGYRLVPLDGAEAA